MSVGVRTQQRVAAHARQRVRINAPHALPQWLRRRTEELQLRCWHGLLRWRPHLRQGAKLCAEAWRLGCSEKCGCQVMPCTAL